MLNMDTKLAKREEEGKIIRTGIVGAGQMGRGMVTQMALMKGIMPAIVSDIKFENVINAFHYAGIKDEDIAKANTLEEANKYMEMGKYVATENSDLISQANLVECAIDVTGVPEVGVKIATDALKNHKHVVMMDVETDVVIGSWLKKLGDENGVIYIVVDPRSSGENGRRGMDQAFRRMTVIELQDYIAWAKWLQALPYVDGSRIGVKGFSFGGTTTAMLVLRYPQYFRCGIAGGGVYDWHLYDTHYTERFMDTPQANPDGYADASVLT